MHTKNCLLNKWHIVENEQGTNEDKASIIILAAAVGEKDRSQETTQMLEKKSSLWSYNSLMLVLKVKVNQSVD